jgi:hypothetical protein
MCFAMPKVCGTFPALAVRTRLVKRGLIFMRQFKVHCVAAIALLVGAMCMGRANAQCGTAVLWHDGGEPTAMLATPTRLYTAGPNFLRIYDTTNQDLPVLLSAVVLDGDPEEIEHANGYLYIALGLRGVQIFDATNPAAPASLFSIAGGDATDVTVTNSTLFIAWNGDLRSYDVTNPASPSFIATLPLGTLGFVESRNNILYAAESRDLHAINVSNPAAPAIVDTISYPAGILALDARPGLVAIQAFSALRIIDVSTPSAMVEVADITVSNALNTVAEFGQVAGTPVIYYMNDNSRLDAKSLADPAAPAPMPAITDGRVRSVAATADDHVYAASDNVLSAYLVSLTTSPVTTAEISTEPGEVVGLGVRGTDLIAAYDNRLVIRNVSNSAAPVDVSTVTLPSRVNALVVQGDLAFVALESAIRIYDLATPASPVLRSTIATFYTDLLAVDANTLYGMDDIGEVIQRWDVSNPAQPLNDGAIFYSSLSDPIRLIASGGTLYLATADRVRIYDARDPADVVLASSITPTPLLVDFADIAVRGSTLVTLTDAGRVELFDTSNRAAPASLATFTAGTRGTTVNFAASLLIISESTYPRLTDLVDAADPANPILFAQTLPAPAPLGRVTATLGETFWAGTLSHTGIDAFRLPGAPRVAIDPADTPACATTGTASLSVTLANPAGATYRWRKGGTILSNGPTAWGSTIAGALSPTLTITDGAIQDLGLYDCVITNSCGSIITRDALLFPGIAPSIINQPQDSQTCPAGSATFSVAWLGTLPATFVWEAEFPINSGTYVPVSDATLTRFTISGATTRFLTIAANPGETLPAALVETRYRCIISNPCADLTTNPASLTLLDASEWTCLGCAPCPADYDQDGGVTGGDLAAFFADFEQGLTCADVDQDGGVTGGDVGVFFAAFEAGGC